MALLTLRRNFCHLSEFWIPGAAAALKSHATTQVHKVVKDHLHVWLRPLLLPKELPKVRLHHACGQSFHSENGSDLHPPGEPSLSPGHPWDQLEQSLQNQTEQVFHRRLNSLTSSEEVVHFLSTLAALPSSLTAGAVRRICEREKEDVEPSLRQAVLENDFFQAWCLRLERDPSRLSHAGLATVLHALILLHVDPGSGLMLSLVGECQHRLRSSSLAIRHLCALGESLVRLQGPGCAALDLILHQLQSQKLETFTPEDIVAVYRILQACPEKVDQHQTFLNTMHNLALSVAPYLDPKSISQVLAALVVLDQTQALPLVIKLGKHVVRHVPRCTGEELRQVLEAFVYFGHSDRFFTEALEQHVAALCLTMDPEVTSTVMEYCGSRHIRSAPILDAVAEAFVCQSEQFSPSQISRLIEPFGKLNYLPPNAPALFKKLENVLLARFHLFPPKALLRLLHSCSLIECHPVNFMAKIFSPFFLQQLQGAESCLNRLSLAQLTQLFLTSILECPFYKGPRLHPRYRVSSFFTPCCSLETPVDVHLYKSVTVGLIDLLGARLYFASKVLTPYCYTIDVEVKMDEEGFVLPFTADEDVHRRVALCIDGPHRFCSNGKHLLGREAIKQRHLRLLGYQVVQIPYQEVELLTSRLELVEYLQRKLFSQNPTVR